MPRKCIGKDGEEKCIRSPVYNYPGETCKIYCSNHMLEGMVSVGQIRCKYPECQIKNALFGYPGGVKEYCDEHKKINMVNLKKPLCKKCKKTQPYYNYPGIKQGIYCNGCKKDGMINVVTNENVKCKCNKIASFNYDGEKAQFCKTCKLDGMINVRNKKCIICKKCQPSFNFPGSTEYVYCNGCKEDGMVNLRCKNCTFPKCPNAATYGNENGKKMFCNEHKDLDMIYISSNKNNHCLECNTVPYYNYKGQKKGIYCFEHKKDNMINVIDKKCEVCNEKIAMWGYEKDKLRCTEHREYDMINLRPCKMCEECNLKKVIYGFPGIGASHCTGCKKSGMVTKPTKKCTFKKCPKVALYGTTVQNHCEEHKLDDEINFVEKTCKGCGLVYILDDKEMCKYCNPNNLKYMRLAKQKEVQNMLYKNGYDYSLTDCIVEFGKCGKERPDFLFELPTHYIVLEVDENQHTSYKCEKARMINISQSLGMQTIFIRYNPDEYTTNKKRENPSKITRFKKLKEVLDKFLNLDTEELKKWGFLSCTYLYYDGYGKNVEKNVILDFED